MSIQPVPNTAWMTQAACAGFDADLWFPATDNTLPPAAIAVCRACPVRAACLDYGLRHEDHGIWGGTTAQWRRQHRRHLRIRLATPTVRVRGAANFEEVG